MAAALPANCVWIIPGYLGVCNGPPLPVLGPDLPPIDIPEVGPDLPPVDLPGSDAAPETGADVEAQSEADTREDVCTEGCWDCIAANSGAPAPVSYQNDLDKPLSGTARRGYAYQEFVCGLGHFPEQRNINEWQFAGYSWDGIEPGPCVMLEAKWNYDEGFLVDDWAGGVPKPLRWVEAARIFETLVLQAQRQIGHLSPFQPEVGLKWVFSHQRSSIYVLFLLNRANISLIETEWRPFRQG